MSDNNQRTRILTTSEGINREAFSAMDWTLFLSISLIWGSSFLLMAIGLDAFTPGLVTLLRVGLGAAALWLVPQARSITIEREDWPRVITLALLWIAIPLSLFPLAQQYVNSAVAGMLNGATPIFTAIIAVALLGRMPRFVTIAGLGIGLAGVVFISAPSITEGSSEALGAFLVLLATLCYGISINISAPVQQRYGSIPLMARILGVATLMVAPFGLLGLPDSSFAWDSLIASAVVGVVGTGLAFVIMGNLVGRVGGTRASFITYVIPVVALVLGVVFRDDVVAPIAIVGVVLVIIGALLASRRET
ncbi:MAG: DMT family transporter [Acidimicrobiia bacterium]